MIDLAGQVEDLSVVDINYPFVDPDLSLGAVEAALARNKLSVIGITPEIYTRRFAKGAFTNPDPVIRHAERHGRKRAWPIELMKRRAKTVAAVALANKTARMIWAMMTRDRKREVEGKRG